MDTYPKGGLIGKTRSLIDAVAKMNIPLYASHAGFFLILSVFPALVLLLSLLKYTGLNVEMLAEILEGVIPAALMPSARKLILSTYYSSSTALVSLSALVALWSASRGIHGLVTGLNAIYQVQEDRGYLQTRLMSVLYTFAFLLVLILTLVLHVFGSTLLDFFTQSESVVLQFLGTVLNLRFFLLLFIQTALFTAIFTVMPNRHIRVRDSIPGALLASSGWLIFSDLFSIYVEHFSSYANIYGSVYAVALSMLWLYSCLSIVFYGGGLNYLLLAHREKKEQAA